MSPRTIHFVSLGCPKNRVDTEVMLGVSGQSGFRVVEDASAAEVIVVNTTKRESTASARHWAGRRPMKKPSIASSR